MISNMRAALVIARRDYIATVWSRAFILFLIGPLLPILFGVTFGSIGAKMQDAPTPVIAIIAPPVAGQALVAARVRLTETFGAMVPDFKLVSPAGDAIRQGNAILARGEAMAVLSGVPDRPTLRGSREMLHSFGPEIDWILNEIRRDDAFAKAGLEVPAVQLTRLPVAEVARPAEADRALVARGAQLLLLFLTMILSGMLLSNLLEEKSNKVIEVLAAAVPVDSIFLGKLFAMLAMSLVGITVWTSAGAAAIAIYAQGGLAALPAPAVGWPAFLFFILLYFSMSYLLIGATFLGIGAQASTVREVQTLSMPVTMAQVVLFGFASLGVGKPMSETAIGAAIFPLSSPFAMIARAAEQSSIWPHLLALLWQALWVALILKLASAIFRRSVLKSGPQAGSRRAARA